MTRKSRPFLFRSLHLPKRVWGMALVYGAASFIHLMHNSEYLVFYPGTPEDATKEAMYLTWLEINGVALLAAVLALVDRGVAATLCLALYGALGLTSLSHYAQGFWSEHTLAANATICAEVLTGVALSVRAVRHLMKKKAASRAHHRRGSARAARRDGATSTFS